MFSLKLRIFLGLLGLSSLLLAYKMGWQHGQREQNPTLSAKKLELLGHHFRDQNDFIGATAAYQLALRQGQNMRMHADLEAHLGLALLQKGQEQEAYIHLMRAKKQGAAKALYSLTLKALAYDVDESGPFPKFAALPRSQQKQNPSTQEFDKQNRAHAKTLQNEKSQRTSPPDENEAPNNIASPFAQPTINADNEHTNDLSPEQTPQEPGETEPEEQIAQNESNFTDCEWPLKRRGARGTFTTEVYLNGETANLIVDTGASLTVIGRDFAEQIDIQILQNQTLTAHTAAGQVEFALGNIDELDIGGRILHDVTVAICDDCATAQMDGLLGLDIQAPLQLSLDVASETLNFGDCRP